MGLRALSCQRRRTGGRWSDVRGHRGVWPGPVAGRIGGRPPQANVLTPTGPARLHPERRWEAKAAGHPLHRGSCSADGDSAGLGADLRGRSGAGAVRLSTRAERPRRREASRTAGPKRTYRGGRRRPFRIFRCDPPCRASEVAVPADQRSLRPEADQDVAGGTGGRGRRAGPSPSDDPEQGRGAGKPSGLSEHAPNNVAKASLIPDSVISRARLRPTYGQGWKPQLDPRSRQADGRGLGEEELT